ncbi:uncharacterized protein G2W53_025490 [Senna tora]|uniref:Uncharacterized protein n=1 Tax=Senna tora TaxID=362788 RepID=A0A834TE16_9FABA|nr:uncharacterized protein G2W53_025490 [Senna tora]
MGPTFGDVTCDERTFGPGKVESTNHQI